MLLRNRLSGQCSPYLQRHAQDPVAWQPWDEAAKESARLLDRPLFISVGYSTCHWCKRMARESFSSAEVADRLNRWFVPVQVDRQELPELDRYLLDMAGVVHQLAGGQGPLGWPLHLVLTPELTPIFAFTYLPPHNQDGRIGLVPLLEKLGSSWDSGQRADMERVGREVVQAIHASIAQREGGDEVPSKLDLEQHLEEILRDCDPIHGGRATAPKFPLPQLLSYLMHAGELHADARPWMQLRTSLWHIVHGGLHDHFDGGFFRYCADEQWKRPHYERMLIDNALLLKTMAQSLSVVEEPWLEQAVERTAEFLLKRLRLESGLFGAGLDAEFSGSPGASVLWRPSEVAALATTQREAELFCAYYDIGLPRAHLPKKGEVSIVDGLSVPRITAPLDIFCRQRGIDPLDIAPSFATLRALVEEVRGQRPQALLDPSEILGWNAAAVSGLVAASLRLERWHWLEAAEQTAEELQRHFWQQGVLVHGRTQEVTYGLATLEDGALWLHACIDLYVATGQANWLLEAGRCAEWVCNQMKASSGEWRLTSNLDTLTPARRADPFDQAHPSGYGLWAEGLLRLHQIEGSPHWRELAQNILEDISPWLPKVPFGTLGVAIATQRWHAQSQPIWVLHAPSLADWRLWRSRAYRAGTPLLPIWPVIHDVQGVMQEEPLSEVRCDRCGTLGCLEVQKGTRAVDALLQQCIRTQRS